jgi:hypothetical protein
MKQVWKVIIIFSLVQIKVQKIRPWSLDNLSAAITVFIRWSHFRVSDV